MAKPSARNCSTCLCTAALESAKVPDCLSGDDAAGVLRELGSQPDATSLPGREKAASSAGLEAFGEWRTIHLSQPRQGKPFSSLLHLLFCIVHRVREFDPS